MHEQCHQNLVDPVNPAFLQKSAACLLIWIRVILSLVIWSAVALFVIHTRGLTQTLCQLFGILPLFLRSQGLQDIENTFLTGFSHCNQMQKDIIFFQGVLQQNTTLNTVQTSECPVFNYQHHKQTMSISFFLFLSLVLYYMQHCMYIFICQNMGTSIVICKSQIMKMVEKPTVFMLDLSRANFGYFSHWLRRWLFILTSTHAHHLHHAWTELKYIKGNHILHPPSPFKSQWIFLTSWVSYVSLNLA